MSLDSRIPDGPIESKWTDHKFSMKLVNPANKRKFHVVIIVGSGLAGASAAASPWANWAINVQCFVTYPG